MAFKVDTTVLRAEDFPVAGLPAIITAAESTILLIILVEIINNRGTLLRVHTEQ